MTPPPAALPPGVPPPPATSLPLLLSFLVASSACTSEQPSNYRPFIFCTHATAQRSAAQHLHNACPAMFCRRHTATFCFAFGHLHISRIGFCRCSIFGILCGLSHCWRCHSHRGWVWVRLGKCCPVRQHRLHRVLSSRNQSNQLQDHVQAG
jgi:hypothetical protein